ncbi:peptidyl-tRNA hydrolase [Candidatus Moduliflexus flocculans]|uniref:Peptidyl-tRNA hydrolase n=1 Tax=Candidatus Moduliflexus flocculans TaxID=1499966 RepID=A0A0S6VTG4_9BACT|nr:peptidyl-tRNA hydrolase [Candidatus Moduliflexus flocculans]
MWLIVGLGNPGRQYAETRHNVGFMVTDMLAEHFPVSSRRSDAGYSLRAITLQQQDALLIQPHTYMNLSGVAVEAVLRQYDESPAQMIVVYDDLDLAPGRLRIRTKGGHGGHKGVKSIIEHLSTQEFLRIRIGIGRPQDDVVDYVLQPFLQEERPVIGEVMRQAIHAIELIVSGQIAMAMNLYNRS